MKTIIFSNLRPEFQSELDKLKSRLDGLCKDFIKGHTRYVAASYASHNVPAANDISLEPYLDSIRGFFVRQNTDISLELQGAIQHEMAAMNIKVANMSNQSYSDEIKLLESENLRDKADLQKIQLRRDKGDLRKQNALLWGFSVFECLAYALAFLQLKEMVLSALVWGAMIGLSQSWGIRSLVIFFRDHFKGQLNWIAKISITVITALVVWALGTFRFIQVSAKGGTALAHSGAGSLLFICITFILVAVVAGMTYLYAPTSEEIFGISEHTKIEDRIKKREARIAVLNQAISDLAAQTNLVAQMHRKVKEATNDMHNRMQAFFKESIGEFKLENRIKRKDSITPECFNKSVEPLQFADYEYDFTSLKINQP